MRWRKCIWLDLDPGLFSRDRENKNTSIPMWHSPNAGEDEGQQVTGEEDISPSEKLGVWLLLVILILMLYVWGKGKNTLWQHCTKGINSHFKNKWEDFTVQVLSLVSIYPGSLLQYPLWYSLLRPPLAFPLLAPFTSGCQEYCWEVTTNSFENKNDND